MVALSPTEAEISELHSGKRVERAPQRIDWDLETAEKSGYPHFMLKEISEQPKALAQTLAGRSMSEAPP